MCRPVVKLLSLNCLSSSFFVSQMTAAGKTSRYRRLYDRSGDGKHCQKTAWGCIVLAYSVIAWGSFVRRHSMNSTAGMQFLLCFHRFRRMLNSATATLSFTHRRSHPRWAAARVCFPPRCCKPGIKGIPRDVKLP